MSDDEKRHDSFGTEKAHGDFARSDATGDVLAAPTLLSTRQVQQFVQRDPPYHFVVGTTGTGKSLLLFIRAVLTSRNPSIVVAPVQEGDAMPFAPTPSFTTAVADGQYWQLDPREEFSYDRWVGLWEWGLLAASLRAWDTALARQEPKQGTPLDTLLQELRGHLPLEDVVNPFDLIAGKLKIAHGPGGQVRGRPQLPDSMAMRRFVERRARHLPPLYLFIDNQDDAFSSNPELWRVSTLSCLSAITLLRRLSARRLHYFMSLRPEVLQHGGHVVPGADLRIDADILTLRWSADELMEAFKIRARQLRDRCLRIPTLRKRDPLRAFFGDELRHPTGDVPGVRIRNSAVERKGHQIWEPIEQYLVRHTMGRPREMIMLGNAMNVELGQAAPGAGPQAVRRAVAETATKIAEYYIEEMAHLWPLGDTQEEKRSSVRSFMLTFVDSNIISAEEAGRIRDRFAAALGRPSSDLHPFCWLTRMGLVGWPRKDLNEPGCWRQHFEPPGANRLQNLPGQPHWLLVHPVLYGPSFHVTSVRGMVVGPDLPFDAELFPVEDSPGDAEQAAITHEFTPGGTAVVGPPEPLAGDPTGFWPESLLDALAKGQLAVLAGSGVSLGDGVVGDIPPWSQVPERFLDECAHIGALSGAKLEARRNVIREGLGLDAMLSELGTLKQILGQSYAKALRRVFRPELRGPGDLHDALIRLPVNALLTTNIDDLFERCAEFGTRTPFHWQEADSALLDLKEGLPILFKVHGTAERSNSVVFSADEYRRARADAGYVACVDYLLASHSFLFVGYGLNDPLDLDLALRENARKFRDSGAEHYALLKDPTPDVIDRLRRDYNVIVKGYAKHDDLPDLLSTLRA